MAPDCVAIDDVMINAIKKIPIEKLTTFLNLSVALDIFYRQCADSELENSCRGVLHGCIKQLQSAKVAVFKKGMFSGANIISAGTGSSTL
jgi:hypothetical protein